MTPGDAEGQLELGVIGNCTVSALIDRRGRYVWACWPHLAADPAFCSLLRPTRQGEGLLSVELDDQVRTSQHYLANTPVLVTTLENDAGDAVELVDFAPRFQMLERPHHPVTFVRLIRPRRGRPRIRVRLRPLADWGARSPERTIGSDHIRYLLPEGTMRLTTDLPIAAVWGELPWVLDRPAALILGPDEAVAGAVQRYALDSYGRTVEHWRDWTRSLSIPLDYQEAVIRAAITLKLSQYSGTGAVIAAMTSSLPESPDSRRTWDYRYCWLRDAAYVVRAMNGLGATRTMEDYLRYVYTAAAAGADLQPVYGIHYETELHEQEATHLQGFAGMGPVRVGNDAWRQHQHDIYGSVILAATHLFFDERLAMPGSAAAFERLEELGRAAIMRFDQPDSGLWEYRGFQRRHTHSAVMCWAACDRLARIAAHLRLAERTSFWSDAAAHLHREIVAAAYDVESNRFLASPGSTEPDAALLQLPAVGFVEPQDPRFLGTLAAIEAELVDGEHVYRYRGADDFGLPRATFLLCSFWYIDALASTGSQEEARERFVNLLAHRTELGLLSEDIEPATGALWGNFPQAYSLVGLINSARRLSRPWEAAG